jgi:hypothetical protein
LEDTGTERRFKPLLTRLTSKFISLVKRSQLTLRSSSSASSVSQTFSSISASISSAHATTSAPISSIEVSSTTSKAAASTPLSEAEIRDKAAKIVANDLRMWQEKFSKAADEGSDDLDERITEITERLITNQAEKVGSALNIELEETINSSFKALKSNIISIVENSKDTEESEEELNTAVRKAGIAIKEKGQAVRTWKQNYDKETNSLVSKAAQDTLEILDHIQDLGLQEIGMRWAWTDGITHKDWTKYHQLKPKFDEWRQEVEQVAINHPGLVKARAASNEVESQAMGTAEAAAKELARLKETGRWKISTGDSSDDWTTRIMPAAAAVVGQKLMGKMSEASEAVIGTATSQGNMESIASVASASIADAASSGTSIASSLSSSVIGTPQGSVESVVSVASESAGSFADKASSSIIGTQQGSVESVTSIAKASASSIADQASSSIIATPQGSAESVASVAKESASSIVDQVSSSVIGTSQGSIESVASAASESASSLSAKASSSVIGTEPGLVEKASSSIHSAASKISKSVSDGSRSISSLSSSVSSSISRSASDASSSIGSSASSVASTASKKVWGGAMAQSVEAKQIVYEDIIDESPDDDTYSEKIQSMASEAGDRFADITRAVSEALLKPTSTQGAVESVTSLAADQYSSALAAASSALYGPERGTGESVASAVSSRYADAVSA